MFKNMERWVIDGVAPPRGAPIKVMESVGAETSLFGETIHMDFVKDAFGNVLGGVRSPYVDAPIATYKESAALKPNRAYAWSFGSQEDFGSEQLQDLYGLVAPHQAYVAKVKASAEQLVKERWLEPQDASEIVRQAELTAIP
jgi:hypothetical protein